MAQQVMAKPREPLITVKSGLYTAVVGALGDILTLFAIPVAPNINVNLYVFPSVLVGGTSGWFLGMLAGFIGALYTPVLWGWFGAIPYNMILGAAAGFFAKRGIRPTIGAFIGHILSIPYMWWATRTFLGMPDEIIMVGMVTTVVQLLVAGVIAEVLLSASGFRKRVPAMEIDTPPAWIANNPILRHPWVSAPVKK
ncbi:MAG TPA: hypothetical protein VFD70_05340 [Anaerolineae bacterium]|nr:hypothetical protein [Anaerolineae bacterium]